MVLNGGRNKMNIKRLICIGGIIFSILNIIDLILTLSFIEYEINPLVINNFGLFYCLKFLTTWFILTICLYNLGGK